MQEAGDSRPLSIQGFGQRFGMGMLWRGGCEAQSLLCISAYAGAGLWDGICMGPCPSSSPPASCGGCSLPGGTGCGRLDGALGRVWARDTVFFLCGGVFDAACLGAAFFFADFFGAAFLAAL